MFATQTNILKQSLWLIHMWHKGKESTYRWQAGVLTPNRDQARNERSMRVARQLAFTLVCSVATRGSLYHLTRKKETTKDRIALVLACSLAWIARDSNYKDCFDILSRVYLVLCLELWCLSSRRSQKIQLIMSSSCFHASDWASEDDFYPRTCFGCLLIDQLPVH